MSKTISRLTCSFCQKNQDEVKKLIAGPGVYVCDECVQQCNELLLKTKDKSSGPVDQNIKCSFCGKSQGQVKILLNSPSKARICDECIDLCNEIVSEELFEATPTSSPGNRAVRVEGPSMVGTLEDLPPIRLLQELAVASKTGILTVTDEGKLINIVLLSGKPIYARVATVNSKGREAMDEFLRSQKQGSYAFLDKLESEPIVASAAFYREVHHVTDAECEIKKEDA